MTWAITIDSAPEVEPVSIDEARAQCRLDLTDETDDALLATYIAAARGSLERHLNRGCLITQALLLTTYDPGDLGNLPVFPIQSVESVETAADASDIDLSTFELRLAGRFPSMPLATGATWPGGIVVAATCGYGDAGTDVPTDLRLAILLGVSEMYDNRGVLDEPFWTSLHNLIGSYRRVAFA